MRDNVYEDYQAYMSLEQLEELMTKWLQEAEPTESDEKEVKDSFSLPVETSKYLSTAMPVVTDRAVFGRKLVIFPAAGRRWFSDHIYI